MGTSLSVISHVSFVYGKQNIINYSKLLLYVAPTRARHTLKLGTLIMFSSTMVWIWYTILADHTPAYLAVVQHSC